MKVPIVFATDNGYAPYCAVAIKSVIQSSSDENDYEIYVLYDCLAPVYYEGILSLSTKNCSVKCICVGGRLDSKAFRIYTHMTLNTLYRLLIADIFREYDKILYLDVDIIANDDVAILYAKDLGNNLIGGKRSISKADDMEPMNFYIKDRLGIEPENYINAGVLLMNLKQFREENVSEQCLKELRERNDLLYMDQDAINLVCAGRIEFIEEYWNYECGALPDFTQGFIYDSNNLPDYRWGKHGIYHFDGQYKPWNNPETPFSELFWRTARTTDFYEMILYRMSMYVSGQSLKLPSTLRGCKKIIIYGAGKIGKQIVHMIKRSGLCRIVLWVDMNYQDKKGLEMPVASIEDIETVQYDHILIAIDNSMIAKKVKELLIKKMGVEPEKILEYS